MSMKSYILGAFVALLATTLLLPLAACGPQDPNPPLSSSCNQDRNKIGATAKDGCDAEN